MYPKPFRFVLFKSSYYLKHGRDPNFRRPIDDYRPVFQNCIAIVGDPYLRSILDYAASLKPGVGKKTFTFIKKVLTDKQDIVMTYGEHLRQQGMQTKSLEIAKNMLRQLHLGIEVVQQVTGLSRQELDRLYTTTKHS